MPLHALRHSAGRLYDHRAVAAIRESALRPPGPQRPVAHSAHLIQRPC
jgi:hypothetical protein